MTDYDKYNRKGALRTFERDIGTMQLTNQPLFPDSMGMENTTAISDWLSRNCEQCHKGKHRKRVGQGFTNPNCRVNKDLLLRQQIPDALIAYQSCRRAQNAQCSYRLALAQQQKPLSLFGPPTPQGGAFQ